MSRDGTVDPIEVKGTIMSGPSHSTEADRQADGIHIQMVLDLMNSQHETTRAMITQNRAHLDEKIDFVVTQIKEEIPAGHGNYHRNLIVDAARRQARIDAAAQGGIRWAAGIALGVLSVWASGVWHGFAKLMGWER